MQHDSPQESKPTSNEGLAGLRRKITSVFLGGVGLGSTGLMAAFIVSPLAAEEISGAASWSGLPSALSILGTAAGTTLLAGAMERWGRRHGLIGGYCLAALGAVLATAAVFLQSMALLLLAMFTIGFGRAGDALSRYLVADLYPIGRRASAIGWMVWVGTVGAVVGPNALGPAGSVAVQQGLPRLAGPYLVTLIAYTLTVLLYALFLRPDPSTLVVEETHAEGPRERPPLSVLFGPPSVRIALAVLVVGQTAMVLIMTMTPLYLRQAGHGLTGVGLVMSSHIVGMFVLSPLTGRLVDFRGRIPIILLGQLVLLVAAMSALLTPAVEIGLVAAALFLLGLGWNFGFVAGSALLSSGLPLNLRSRLQGVTDSLIWASAALASATSGFVLATLGYDILCLSAALLLLIPATVLFRYRRSITSQALNRQVSPASRPDIR